MAHQGEHQNQNEHHNDNQSDGSMFASVVLVASFLIVALLIYVISPPTLSAPVVASPDEDATTAEAETAIEEDVAVVEEDEEENETVTEDVTQSIAFRTINGERLFSMSCTACHGFSAQGISGLGPSMMGNEFINSLSNHDLVAFISVGRQASDPNNSTGVTMPARGGNPALTDEDLESIVIYIRSLNPDVEVLETSIIPFETTDIPSRSADDGVVRETTIFAPVDLTGINAPREDTDTSNTVDTFFLRSENIYSFSCAGCHGLDGKGTDIFEIDLADSELLQTRNGVALLELFTRSMPPADPREGFVHPYRGGYPELDDEGLLSLIGYLYELSTP